MKNTQTAAAAGLGRAGFYTKLALGGMRKNRRLYLPFLLTGSGMVIVLYILRFLQVSPQVQAMPGASSLTAILQLGSWVIAVFSTIFLFYTNSFLMRRRQREFGLYNVLGMSKRHIAVLLLYETLLAAAVSLALGLFLGVALSKLAELCLLRLLNGSVSFRMTVPPGTLLSTAGIFGVIFALLYLNSLWRLFRSSTLSLLHSETAGEKPPRANGFLGLLGVALLGTAYYLAVSIQDPIEALALFFVAVILVILATYLLMISGSVLLCRLLQKNKRYYYRPNHFVSVSSMAFRMKRNGAGLASICILATMVLVMLSSTTCLYCGTEDTLRSRYPRELSLETRFDTPEALNEETVAALRRTLADETAESGGELQYVLSRRTAELTAVLSEGCLQLDAAHLPAVSGNDDRMTGGLAYVHILPLADYNHLTGAEKTLAEDEVLLYAFRTDYTADTVCLTPGETLTVREQLTEFPVWGVTAASTIPTVTVIVPDLARALRSLITLRTLSGGSPLQLKWTLDFDTGLPEEQQTALLLRLSDEDFLAAYSRAADWSYFDCESRAEERSSYYGMYGSLFFLGIMLSLVFILAAVLMIYYKQVCEGYEDQARFTIMQHVGMCARDIHRSINSQLLTVFYLPLVGAGCHLAFAFPMIRKLLLLFNLNNVRLFALTNLVSFLLFALFYALVYRLTSNAYYAIVSSQTRE